MPDLPLTVEDVDRHHDDADLRAGEPQVDDLDSVREVGGEPVTGPEPAGTQQVRQAVAPRIELAERERSAGPVGALALEGGRVAPADERTIEEVGERHRVKNVALAAERSEPPAGTTTAP